MTRHVVVLDVDENDPKSVFFTICVYRKGKTHILTEYVPVEYCSRLDKVEALESARILVNRYNALLIDNTGEN